MVRFFDKTDGVTPEVALTVTACKLTLMVDDGNVPTLVLDVAPTASGGANDMVHVTGDDAGFYDLELAAANVNYLGRAMLAITDAATHCPVFHEFMILPAMVYDSLVLGTDDLDTNVTKMNNVAASAITTIKAVQGIAVDGVITTVTNQHTLAQIATGVWTDTTAGDFTTALSVGKSVMNGVALGTGLTVNAVAGLTASDVGAIKTKTDFLPSITAGAAGGVFIAGSNAATTVVSLTCTNAWTTGSIACLGNFTTSQFICVLGMTVSDFACTNDFTVSGNWLTTGTTTLTGTVLATGASNDIRGVKLSGTTQTFDALLSLALTESYAADGATFTIPQALYMIYSSIMEVAISGTTLTVNKLDGTTAAMTATLSDATNPVSRTRAT